MKFVLASALCLLSAAAMAQNTVPLINITSLSIDEVAQELTINYQLSDADGDACEVWLKYSEDGANYFEVIPGLSVSGDAGDGIEPGDALTAVWNYEGITAGIGNVHIQIWGSDGQEVSIADMVNQVDASELLSTLQTVEGERHYTAAPTHLADVRTFIFDAFADAGLQTENHDFIYADTEMANILGRKPGARDESITYIIDGHFDGVPNSPGADDNGSAVAGVLEALRILSQYNFEHSIRFIGFDAEELGLRGSQRYVQNAIEPFEEINGVLNFEMIGYYSDEPNSQSLPVGFELLFPDAAQEISDDDNRGNFLTVVGNVDSNPLISAYIEASETYVPELRLISIAVPGTGTIAPDLRRSDHSRFWDAGMQALMLTDGSEFRNFNYHTPGDVIATLDFGFMENVVKATVAAAAQLAVPISASHDQADLSDVLSVHDHSHKFPAELNIFPNPSNGILTLEVSQVPHAFRARLEVFAINGQRQHREIVHFSSGSNTATINLQNLPAGAYILHLNASDGVASAGFIIEK
ncbi:MAG TPA: M20/M25/M40 family metallo-hydrolase [Cryomorphaceae bacterium]|nr:M20/M25/M40 family metallo-hydrolase [Cryomorphaceae bacterium]